MGRAAGARCLAHLRQGWVAQYAVSAAATAEMAPVGLQHAVYRSSQPSRASLSSGSLPCLPATISSAASWRQQIVGAGIRLPVLQEQHLGGMDLQLRRFCSSRDDAGDPEIADSDATPSKDRDSKQLTHARPRWREMDTNSAHRNVAYHIELGLLHRQLFDRSVLDDKVREKFKLDLWDNVIVDVKRTIKVTKSAKVETFHAIVATGNHQGMFGIGEGADSNVQKAVSSAFFKSFANVVNVPLYRGHTIYHRIDHRRHTTNIMLLPKEAGKGIRASNLMYELCTLAGIKNVTVKIRGRTRNKSNLVQLFVEALGKQTLPHDGVEGTGAYIREVLKPVGRRLPYGIKRGVDLP